MDSIDQVVEIDYTNWRGERFKRRIIPKRLIWGHNEWHTESQWLLNAFDLYQREMRTFAMASIHSWTPTRPE